MIYLDNAATTPISSDVAHKMEKFLELNAGNPSSEHQAGKLARRAIEDARNNVAKFIGAEPDEIYFTSGATESNNIVISSVDSTSPIITSPIEHDSILKSCENLASMFFVTPVDENGSVIVSKYRELLRLHSRNQFDPGLVSIMAANNETGSLQYIEVLSALAHKENFVFHTDATQAIGKVPINVKEQGIDLMSFSAHKFHGPKGVGVLYKARECPLSIHPLVYGGGQESGLRSGTENVDGIVGLGEAILGLVRTQYVSPNHYCRLSNIVRKELALNNINYIENSDYKKTQSIMSLTFPGINSSKLVSALDTRGVCVSRGSACNSNEIAASHVLTAMKISKEMALDTIRISFSIQNTEKEVAKASKILCETIKNLEMLGGASL